VVSISEDGRRASFKGKRGAATVTFESLIPAVKFAIERAHEKGKRKDSYEEFIAGRSASPQEGIAAAQDKAQQAQAAIDSGADTQGQDVMSSRTSDTANKGIRRSFAGQQAATADTMALATAQQRLEAGEDAEAVRQETGWFKGNDGKWRFEIDDSRAFLKGTGTFGDVVMARMAALEQGGLRNAGDPVRLGDVLRHESLFAAYPALRDIEVQFTRRGDTAKGRLATDDAGVQAIHVRYELDDKEALSVLLHEIQHGFRRLRGLRRVVRHKA